MAGAAQAQGWSNPSVSLSLPSDGNCMAGPYANTFITQVQIQWTAFNTDAVAGRGLQLVVWDEGDSSAAVVASVPYSEPGQLPQQTRTDNRSDSHLVASRYLYYGLRDTWASGSIRSWTQPPTSPPNVTAPADGVAGYTRLDLATDPDCVPRPEISVTGNGVNIADGDSSPASGDHTDFGAVDVSGVQTFRTFTVTNPGTGTLTLGSNAASISGSAAADFVITSQPAASVSSGGGTTTVVVRFDPSAIGTRNATLTIANDDADESPYNFAIRGTGAAPEIAVTGNGVNIADGDSSPAAGDHTDFGSTVIGSGTLSRTFTITNSGGAPLTLGSNAASLSGGNAADFSITSQPATSVPASGGTTSVTVEFDPSALGSRSTTLSIANNDSDESPFNFTIQGTGTGAPEIAVTGNGTNIVDGDSSPASGDHTDFGSANPSGGTVSRTFTITNSGAGTLVLGSGAVSFSGTNATDFSVTAQPATSVAAGGGTTTFTVEFDPSITGSHSATLSIANNDADESPFDFAVQGIGEDLTAPSGYAVVFNQPSVNAANETAVSFDFGGAEVGADYDYTISSNNGGAPVSGSGTIATATDTISSIDVSGLNDGTLTLSVTLTDGSGNTGSAETDTVNKDATAPSGYSVTLGQDPVTAANETAVSFTFAGGEASADYAYTISSNNGGTNVTGSGTLSGATDTISGIDVSGLNDGTLTLSVTLTDPAGNTGTAATDTTEKDAGAPSGYSVSFDQTAVNAGNADSVSFTFAGAEVGTDYDYTITSSHGGGSVTGSGTIATATDQIGGIDVLSLVDGTLTLSVRLTDSGGNTGSAATATVSKDVVVPSGYSVSLDQDPVTAANDNAISFTFASAEFAADYAYTITSSGGAGSVSGSGSVGSPGQQVSGIDVTGLPDGTLTLSVTLTDDSGNAGSAATDTAEKDAAVPSGYSVAFDQDPVGPADQASVSFTFASAEIAADYAYTITSSSGGGSVTGSGTIATATDRIGSIDVSGLPDGILTLSVTLTDSGGNTGGAATDTVTKDTTAPAGFSVSFDQDPVTGASESAISFTFAGGEVSADYSYTISSNGGGANVTGSGTLAGATDQIGSIDVSGLGDGTLTLSVTLTDGAGNASGTQTDTVTKDTNLPGFSKAFAPAAILVGDVSTLTFTIDNSARGLSATALDFTDNFPASMEVAATPNASTTCTGGTLTAVAGAGVVSYTGGSVGAGAACTVDVDVTATAAGSLANTSGSLTSSAGNSGTANATLTVAEPSLSVDDPSVTEGDAGTSNLSFTVTLAPASAQTVTVDYATSNGTATAGSDYTATTGTLTFTPGQTSRTVTVTVLNETVVEPDETVILTLSNPSNATIGDATGTGTIQSDDTDATAPVVASIERRSPASEVTRATTLSWTVTFSEDVTGVDAADFAVAGSTASVTGVTGSGDSYDVTVSGGDLAGLTGTVGLGLPASVSIDDLAGNALTDRNPSGADETYALDHTPPTVDAIARETPANKMTHADTLTWAVMFSESVTGVDAADFAVAGSTASVTGVSGAGASYSVTVSGGDLAGMSGEVGLDLAAGVSVNDLAGNALADPDPASADETYTIDTDVPGVTLDAGMTEPVAAPFTLTVTFSEPVSGFSLAGLNVVNATAGNFQTVSTRVYTVSITPPESGSFSLSVPAGAATDSAGNDNTASDVLTLEADSAGPEVVSVEALNALVTNVDTPAWRVTFSEAVEGVDGADFILTGAPGAAFSVSSGDDTVFDITASGGGLADLDGEIVLGLAAGQDIADSAGNALADTAPTGMDQGSVTLDNTAPGVTLAASEDEVTGPFTVTISVSEAVTGFVFDDLVLDNATAETLTQISASEYTVEITPETFGEIGVSVGADAAADAAGNGSQPASLTTEAVTPQVDVEIDIDVDNNDPVGVAGTAVVSNPGELPVDFRAEASASWLSVTPETGTIEGLSDMVFTVSVTEEVRNLAPGDYTGRVTIFRPVTSSATGGGPAAPAAAGEAVLVEVPVSLSLASTVGTLQLVSTTPGGPSGDANFALASSLSAIDGQVLATSGGRAETTVMELAGGTFDILQSVPQGWRIETISCTGDADQGSQIDTASGRIQVDLDIGEAMVCTFENVRDEDAVRLATQRVIRNFMLRRADRIIEAAPDLSRRLGARDAMRPGGFAADVDGGRYTMSMSTSLSGVRNAARAKEGEAPDAPRHESETDGRLDIWLSAEMSGVSDNRAGERAESDFGVTQLGIDWAVSDDMLVGAMFQYDWMDETASEIFVEAGAVAGAEVDGTGWMAGPYMVWRFADGVIFDGAALYGQSRNTVNPLGLYEDDFDTERWMVRANLTGEYVHGPWMLRPQATLTHFEETQASYTDSLDIGIPQQTIALGRLAAGPEVIWRHARADGQQLELSTGVRAIWDYRPAELLNDAGLLTSNGSGMRADGRIGIATQLANGARMGLEVSLSGIGNDDFEASSARLNLRVPLSLGR